jgi:hypothetical protein
MAAAVVAVEDDAAMARQAVDLAATFEALNLVVVEGPLAGGPAAGDAAPFLAETAAKGGQSRK